MPSRPEPLLLLDRYRVDGVLGEGGQAVVLRSFDTRLGVHRAVKVLRPGAARRQAQRSRFLAEAHILASIEHSNIVRVYDVDVSTPAPFLVMELVTGGSLWDRIADRPLAPHLTVWVLDQLCAGLDTAHDAGIVHRDVKPHNVLVAPGRICKVVDFGIAHVAEGGRTLEGVGMGTDGFMAPEQAMDAATVDRRADVYGAAMTAYVLLTRRSPVDLLGQRLAGIPPAFVPILTKAISHDRSRRYETAGAFADAMRAAAQDVPLDPEGATLSDVGPSRSTDGDEVDERMIEVEEWLRAAHSLPPTPSTSPVPPKVAPYVMARRTAEPVDHRPGWIAEVPASPMGFVVSLDAAERKASLDAQVRRVPTRPNPSSRLVWGTALALLGAVSLAVAVGTVGWVRGSATQAEAAAQAEFEVVVAERLNLLSSLRQLGSDEAALTDLWARFDEATTPGARAEAADALVSHAETEAMRLTDPGSPQRATLESELAPMLRARDRWRETRTTP